jgi:hypothetical protein
MAWLRTSEGVRARELATVAEILAKLDVATKLR